jgi:hypothetical protein
MGFLNPVMHANAQDNFWVRNVTFPTMKVPRSLRAPPQNGAGRLFDFIYTLDDMSYSLLKTP